MASWQSPEYFGELAPRPLQGGRDEENSNLLSRIAFFVPFIRKADQGQKGCYTS